MTGGSSGTKQTNKKLYEFWSGDKTKKNRANSGQESNFEILAELAEACSDVRNGKITLEKSSNL